jgi:hypothetical protein
MQLKNRDYAVIRQALKVAMEHDDNQQASYSYREVLAKLANGSAAEYPDEGYKGESDGFRFDYDDASEY